jgi:uncharacterized damage-inducible protein DinB
MTGKARQIDELTASLESRWQQVSRKLYELAAELPGEKYEWRPQPGVRTCGEVLRHVAFWNRYVADSVRGKAANDTLNELSASEYPNKKKILHALSESAADAASALREKGALDVKTSQMVVTFLEHTSEHYGQMVVYARLMAVTPPASRG